MPIHLSRHNPGLYIHIPFCLSRCHYCAFTSEVYSVDRADLYSAALIQEILSRREELGGAPPSTLFIGGGTPSCLSLSQLESLLAAIPFPAAGGEATIEMNPDTVEARLLAVAGQYGINRCSIGVQTFNPDGLALLGRRHDAETAVEAVRLASHCFPSVNIDLISGWPGQTLDTLRIDLQTAVDLGVTHLSCYSLILEESSRLARLMENRGMAELDEDCQRQFWDTTVRFLTASGYEQFETSNFALPGFRCQHNVNTWKGLDYCGIGASAHSHIGGRRFANTCHVGDYIKAWSDGKSAEAFSEVLEPEAKARECAVFWLRLADGIDCAEFKERTGFDLRTLYGSTVERMLADGVLEAADNGAVVRVAQNHRAVLDAILVDLV